MKETFTKIVSLAQKKVIKEPIKLMKQNQESSFTLTQEQVACLMANAFLCTFKPRKWAHPNDPNALASINFIDLYNESQNTFLVAQKIKALIHYLLRVNEHKNYSNIFIQRNTNKQNWEIRIFPFWELMKNFFCKNNI
eukprot:Anaeramoba_ignava/a626696_8.p1 GENE.a626696_8~~a626696_8.p1  ORF type:complete len:138 (-),score=40.58 a626696_8:16-429(-)